MPGLLALVLLGVLATGPIAAPPRGAGQGAQPGLSLVLNIPAFRLDVREPGFPEWSVPVAVGMPKYPTPRGEYLVGSVEWNPWWIPPDSPWAAREKVTRPGPTNPMGRVKLHFRPLYFLHGTPWPHSIGSAASHGCVRMRNEDALRLGRVVMRHGAPEVPADSVEAMIADSTRTHMVTLTQPVPVSLRYDLVEVRAGRLLVHRDIYRLRPATGVAEVMTVLASAGWDTSLVDTLRVRALLRRARTRSSSTPADSLGVPLPAGTTLDATSYNCIIVQ